MNKLYCIKCRRKLNHKDYYNYNPDFTNYISANSWICEHCQILYTFVGTSHNQDAIIAFHRMKQDETTYEGGTSYISLETIKETFRVGEPLSFDPTPLDLKFWKNYLEEYHKNLGIEEEEN